MPAHTNTPIRSHSSGIVFKKETDLTRRVINVPSEIENVYVVNGTLMLDGVAWSPQKIVGCYNFNDAKMLWDLASPIHRGLVDNGRVSIPNYAHLVIASRVEEIEIKEITVKHKDKAVLHIHIHYTPYFRSGDTIELGDYGTYVATTDIDWHKAATGCVSQEGNGIIPTAVVLEKLIVDGKLIRVEHPKKVVASPDALLVHGYK